MSAATPPLVLLLSGGILSTNGRCTPCVADVLQIGVKLYKCLSIFLLAMLQTEITQFDDESACIKPGQVRGCVDPTYTYCLSCGFFVNASELLNAFSQDSIATYLHISRALNPSPRC
jgi:hypothetical protein